MLTDRQKKDLKKRLRFVAGQLDAIERMVEDDRSPEEIYVQLLSMQSGFAKSVMTTFEDEHRRALASLIVEREERCPGEACDVCDAVADARARFPNLTTKEVLRHLSMLELKE
jgi:DNA-binding FrmR family transcriptional regulator